MQKYAADRADGLTENIAFYWEVGDLLVPLHYNHVLLLQCVCNPADEPAVKVKDSIIEMNMARSGFSFMRTRLNAVYFWSCATPYTDCRMGRGVSPSCSRKTETASFTVSSARFFTSSSRVAVIPDTFWK